MIRLRRTALALGLAALAAACAPLPTTNPIGRETRAALTFSAIEVTTTGTAFESTRAADYASRLDADLQGAIAREFSDRLATGGVRLAVDIARLNVAGSTTTAFGRDRSILQGTVRVIDTGGTVLGTYQIQAVAGDAARTTTGALIGAAVNSADGFYRELVIRFAADVRAEVLGRPLPGERLLRGLTAG